MKMTISIGVVLWVLASLPVWAQGGAHIEFIDTGTPKNGDVVMTGWHGVIVRVVLDTGDPITRVNLGAGTFGGYIAGNIAQRWTDPNGHGNYTQTSPGPLTANNSFDSDFNFDSHFLVGPGVYSPTSVTEYNAHDFLTSRTGLTSDGFVGYGASSYVRYEADPVFFLEGGLLRGTFDVDPALHATSIDTAYVVTDSAFQVEAGVTGLGGPIGTGGVFVFPEPGGFLLSISGAIIGLLRRPRLKLGRERRAEMCVLEPRIQLTSPTPTGVVATLGADGSANVAWNDMGMGISYAVERSADGTSGWESATTALLPPGTTHFTNSRMDATRAYYRVSATDGTDTATSAAVQESIPTGVTAPTFEVEAEPLTGGGVRLNWELNPTLASSISIYRKATGDSAWPTSALATVSVTGAVGHYDDSLSLGASYEYRLDFSTQEKFIYAGNAKAAQHSRGVALLVIDESLIDNDGTSLQADISGFANDLIGEGYHVETRTAPRVDVPQTAPPDTSSATIASFFGPWKGAVQTTKNTIRSVWDTYGTDLTNVILIGHVPVPYSGDAPADSHPLGLGDHQGAWPTDMYYATLSTSDSNWTDIGTRSNSVFPPNANYPGDGKFDQDWAPALTDVAIGRIDLARTAPGGYPLDVGDQPSDSEIAGLQAYFLKNHQYRTGQWDVKHQALVDRDTAESFGNGFFYDPTRLASNVGGADVKNGTTSAPNNATDRTDHDLNNDTWLFTYAAGSGWRYGSPLSDYSTDYIRFDPSMSRGLAGNHYTLAVTGKHQSVFNFFFGSFIGDWDGRNSMLRTPLGEDDGYGLTAAWGARPVWDIHRMGLGGTIGESLLVTQNDRGAYTYDGGYNLGYDGRITTSLMGDPTLRQDVVKPVSNVVATSDAGGNVITWGASAESGIDGYYVYRATAANGPWTRLNTSVTTSTSYTDTTATSVDGYYYMVRADKLTVTPSGSYYNLSLGAVSRPVVVSKVFNWQGHVPTTANPWKQWIDVQFSQGVSLAPSQLALSGQLWDTATSTLVAKTLVYNTDFKLVTDPADRTSRIVFLDPATGGAGFAPNGIWTLTVAGTVANSFDRTLGADETLSFTFLIADANDDHSVDFNDMVIMAQNYNMPTPDPDHPRVWGDFNSDGNVDFYDLTLLGQLYNITLPPP